MKNEVELEYWRTEGINNYRNLFGSRYHEGMDNVNTMVEYVGNRSVRDIGCGHGRLCALFTPEQYVGYDICEAAIKKGLRLYPTYKFVHWDLSRLPPAEVTLFVHGPSCVDDGDIEEMMDLMCWDVNTVVLSDPMDFTRIIGTHQFVRNIATYDTKFDARGFKRVQTKMTKYEVSGNPLIIARWDRT